MARKYEKSDITVGMRMICDGGPVISGRTQGQQPPAYGQPLKKPDFARVNQQLDDATRRLEQIAQTLRDVRRGKA